MRIKNWSKIYSTDKLREVISFVKPSGISNFVVHLKNSKDNDWGGRAYWAGCSVGSSGGSPLIVVRIGKQKFPIPYKPPHGSGYLTFKWFAQDELLVHFIAHELRHLWQAKHPKGYRVWGARGQFSERDADAYAIHKVREWRRR